MTNVTIGQLARHLGIGASTLRYYERVGLLHPLRRTAAGYRLYGSEAAARLRFIRRAQDLGFSLDQVAELLALSGDPGASAGDVKRIAQEKIADIEGRIRDLQRMRAALRELDERCAGHGSTDQCPILDALSQEPPAGEDRQ